MPARNPAREAVANIPHSSALLSRALRISADLELAALAEILTETPGRFRPRADQEKPISSTVINKREHGQGDAYWLWERYANWWGHPIGVFYLLSQLSRYLVEGRVTHVTAVSNQLREIAEWIEEEKAGLVAVTAPELSSSEASTDEER